MSLGGLLPGFVLKGLRVHWMVTTSEIILVSPKILPKLIELNTAPPGDVKSPGIENC